MNSEKRENIKRVKEEIKNILKWHKWGETNTFVLIMSHQVDMDIYWHCMDKSQIIEILENAVKRLREEQHE